MSRNPNSHLRRRFLGLQTVAASPAAIFPLLCPVREYEWIPGWDCRMVYSESGLAEPGCVFQTDREADGGVDTWVISRHEPNRRIAFVRVNALRAMHYEIDLEALDTTSTRLTWRQTVTALNEAGNRHVAALEESDFLEMVARIETLLEEFLSKAG
ncbi:MAG: hypothetical protein GVY32_06740 [Gammaproteobacteria bacterium]|jgi:hypothetical protein|nr:hypothetical protein [Gammaproteobacteria bacterium]